MEIYQKRCEYENIKVNFKTFEKIVHDEIKPAQKCYYLNIGIVIVYWTYSISNY